MTDYLARLKDRLGQTSRPPPNNESAFKTFNRPSRGVAVGIEGFEGTHGTRVLRAGVPDLWFDALARMDRGVAPKDVQPQRWALFLDDWALFLNGPWAGTAASRAWQSRDLFGCDPHRPFARLDQQGLLWLIRGGELVEMDNGSAVFTTFKTFNRLTYRRATSNPATINVWDLQNLQSTDK